MSIHHDKEKYKDVQAGILLPSIQRSPIKMNLTAFEIKMLWALDDSSDAGAFNDFNTELWNLLFCLNIPLFYKNQNQLLAFRYSRKI